MCSVHYVPRAQLLLHALFLSAVLLATEANAGRHPSSAFPRTATARKDVLNPVALGMRYATRQGIMPTALSPLLRPEPAHAAFSGGKTVPPMRWHHRFFRNNQGRSFFQTAADKLNGSDDRRSEGEERAAGRRRRRKVKLFGMSASSAVAGASTATAAAPAVLSRPLSFWESMICGAISRSVASTVTHPANAMKTILQTSASTARRGGAEIAAAASAVSLRTLARPSNLRLLTRGAGAQFLLSIPQGAFNFAVLECIRRRAHDVVSASPFGELLAQNGVVCAALDFLSSATSTACCSVLSGPIGAVTDNIMAGNYPNLPRAVVGIASEGGLGAFYAGWWPSMCGKIPSYGLTWVCFQRLKEVHSNVFDGRPPTNLENSIMGCVASGAVVCVMMPMDTIKVRIVTQAGLRQAANVVPYRGMRDCAIRMLEEEGVAAFYKGLTPRLLSVMPTVGIQFGVYECMKRLCLERCSVAGQEVSSGSGQCKMYKKTSMRRPKT